MVQDYPPSPNGVKLSEARRNQQINIRDAVKMLSIRASELSGLEMGRFTLSPEDWERVFSLLEIVEKKDSTSDLPRLDNWGMIALNSLTGLTVDSYTAPECIYYVLIGKIFGSTKFRDGREITTAELIGVDRKKNCICTKDGMFVLGPPDPVYEKMFPGAKERIFKQAEKEQRGDKKITMKPSKGRRKS